MASARPPTALSVPLARPAPLATALRLSPECPACGRKSVIVFPDVRVAASPAEAPLVCLACCRGASELTPPGGQ